MRRSRTPALALTVFALLLAFPALAHAAEPTFTFTGRGWGHGIGMSQYGSKGYAEHGWTYDRILKRYYQGTTLGTVPGKKVRVAIQKDNIAQPSWRMRANSSLLKVKNRYGRELEMGTDTVYTFTAGPGGVVIVKDQASRVVTSVLAPAAVWERGGGQPEVLDASGPLDWTSVCYKGEMWLVVSGSNLYAYNHVPMETYVTCVGPREMPASWHAEALKVQAVAARSYAYVSLRSTGDYDVYCTTRSQVYNGWGRASGGTMTRHSSDYLYDAPVAATANKVVTYGTTVVQTFFTSTSGGHTENIENVWPGATPRPYYTGVADEYESVSGSPYHVWPEDDLAFTASGLRSELLEQNSTGGYKYFTPDQVPASIVEVRVTQRGVSGRVKQIVLEGAAGDDKTIEGGKIASFKSALG
ncbi:MAG: SpoIID/LytB domain-containing protein, partial [Actinobacteria bacterium]